MTKMPYPPMHHAAEATLVCHAAGGLDEASRAVVATHLYACPHCREVARLAEAVGGQLLDGLAPASLAPDALAHALARLDRPAPPAPPAPPADSAALGDIALPPSLLRYARRPGGLGRWRWVAPGIRHIRLLPEPGAPRDGSTLYLLKLAPGSKVPEHGHRGHETVCVLAGSYSDRLGRFGPGDLAEADAEVVHQPVADAGQDCICLIATTAPLRFHGRAARLLQPVLGF